MVEEERVNVFEVMILTTGMRNWTVQDSFPRQVVFSNMNPLTDLNTSSALFKHQLMVIS